MINKEINTNLQITLKKEDYETLLMIQKSLIDLLAVDLTKSQTIAFLIRNYQTPKDKENTTKNTAKNKGVNYQAQINALKDKINVSYTRLSQILGIPESTLKKYAYGKQQPKEQNEKIIIDALKKYGIK